MPDLVFGRCVKCCLCLFSFYGSSVVIHSCFSFSFSLSTLIERGDRFLYLPLFYCVIIAVRNGTYRPLHSYFCCEMVLILIGIRFFHKAHLLTEFIIAAIGITVIILSGIRSNIIIRIGQIVSFQSCRLLTFS